MTSQINFTNLNFLDFSAFMGAFSNVNIVFYWYIVVYCYAYIFLTSTYMYMDTVLPLLFRLDKSRR